MKLPRKCCCISAEKDIFNINIEDLKTKPHRWLVTGCAGFIGSNLIETLLDLGQTVTGLDHFSTGFQYNLEEVEQSTGNKKWQNFTFIKAKSIF